MRMTAWLLIFLLSLPVWSQAANNKKQVKLLIRNSTTGLSDEATIYLDNGSSPAYLFSEDAKKVFNPTPWVPQIYTLSSDSVACLLNSFGLFTGPTNIRVGIKTDTAGDYTISPSLIDNFDVTSLLLLEDKQSGTFHDLRSSDYHFSLLTAQENPNRFVLHISYPAMLTTTDADCNNTNGSISIVQDSSVRWSTCSLYDSIGFPMGSYNLITGSFSFTALPEGHYSVVFNYNGYLATKYVVVRGHKITVSITASAYQVTIGQLIQFFSSASNTMYYHWDFGDNTIITGVANPESTYYENGIYPVVLTCTNNSGCYSTDTLFITVGNPAGVDEAALKGPTVYYADKQIYIVSPVGQQYTYVVSNIIGESIMSGSGNGPMQTISLQGRPAGIYILTYCNGHQRFSNKLLVKNQ